MCIVSQSPEIHFHQRTTLTPEQFVSGLTDFGPGRSSLFSNSTDEYLKVHHRGRAEADVTEGAGGIWERLQYDWSNPNEVVLTTVDSNVWGGASGHTYTFTRQPNGTTDIDLGVVREGKNFKGRVLGLVLRTIGRRILERAFENSVKAIEAQNGKVENYEAELPHSGELHRVQTQCVCALTNECTEEQFKMTRIKVNATEGLEIIEQHGDQDSVLRLRGRLNIDSSPDFRDRLLATLRAESPKAVIVDLKDVTYIDSSGIATLIEGLKVARKQQTTLRLQGLHDRLLHLFQVTGVLTLFESDLGIASSGSKVS